MTERLAIAADPNVTDVELESLLSEVYVDGGFTSAAVAGELMAPARVRARGKIFTARDDGALVGMIILVPPGSQARQIATDAEPEVHLLAVRGEQRGRGLGRLLLQAVVDAARDQGHARLVLSTQESMAAAHALYAKVGFARAPRRDWIRAGRRFLAYEKSLADVG
jgi:GNAT superfamily N-acetyltransferase